LQPLNVMLKALGENDFENLEVRVEKICCEFCEEKFFIAANLESHVKSKHQDLIRPSEEDEFLMKNTKSCVFCKIIFTDSNNLNKHIGLHHKDDDGFRCKFAKCSRPFKTEKTMEEHFKKAHFPEGRKSPVECDWCKKWYANKSAREEHRKLEHPEKPQPPDHRRMTFAPVPCKFCSATFTKRANLHKHMQNNHREAVKCKISNCTLYFETKKEMDKHFKITHCCRFCHSTFNYAQLLFAHMKKAHAEKRCKLSHCNFYSDSEQELEAHHREKHAKNCECIYCGKSFVNRQRRSHHVRKIHSDVAIKCGRTNCAHFVKNRADLEQHEKEAHKITVGQKKFVECIYCGKTCPKRTFFGHLKALHPGEVFRCKYNKCFSHFKSEIDLEKHHKEKHVGKYNCANCDYATNFRANIRDHFLQHHSLRDIKCPDCPTMFGSQAVLKCHISDTHKKDKCPHCLEMVTKLDWHLVSPPCNKCSRPFPCRKLLVKHRLRCKRVFECLECGRKFSMESKFKYHVTAKHKFGQKWRGYECKFCGDLFSDLKSVRSHQVKKHPVETEKCDLCEERFSSLHCVATHKLRVHGIGGFECKKCDKVFATKCSLKNHLKWNHDTNDPRRQMVQCADCESILTKRTLFNHYLLSHF